MQGQIRPVKRRQPAMVPTTVKSASSNYLLDLLYFTGIYGAVSLRAMVFWNLQKKSGRKDWSSLATKY